MTELNLNNLRQLLDEYERYANSIKSDQRTAGVANELLAVIAEARESLRPSTDSTANYIDSKQVIERLAALRERAERAG